MENVKTNTLTSLKAQFNSKLRAPRRNHSTTKAITRTNEDASSFGESEGRRSISREAKDEFRFTRVSINESWIGLICYFL